ncbi:MAG: hypothetical protein CL840_05840 [Crocinitomicaceae bacterium]|nr:hypothetical protein [Crocinitomicaceae bacterium]
MKQIGGIGTMLIFSFFSLFGQVTDSAASEEVLFFQLKAYELEVVSVLSDSQQVNNLTLNPIASNTTSTMDEVLEKTPQVQLIKRGSFAYDPQINALGGGQITVSIDGMRIFGACTDKMDPSSSYIEPINLKKAEVSCHSNASMQGSNVGGSLNLRTRKAKFSTIAGELNGSLNSVSMGQDFSGGVNLGGKKLAIRMNGAIRNHDNYKAGGGEIIKYTQYQKQNLSINLRNRLGEKWILEGDYLYDEANDVGFAALPMDVAIARTHLASVTATGYSAISGIDKIQIKVYGNQVYHLMDDSKRPDEEVAMRMDMPGWSDTYGAFAKLNLGRIGKHKIQLKTDYYYNFRRAEMTMFDPNGGADMFMLTWPDVQRNVLGVAGVDNIELNDKNSLAFSGRVDWATTGIEDGFGKRQLTGLGYSGDEVYVHFPYSISVLWNRRIGSNYQVSWSTSSSSRLPTTSEMYGYYLFNKEDGYDYIGRPDIKTEKSLRTNLELKRKNRKVDWTVTAGYNRLFDFIYGVLDSNSSAMTIGGNGVKYFQNLSWAQIINSSFQLDYLPFKNWSISTRFNYNWGEKYDKSSLPQIQPLTNVSAVKFKRNKFFLLLESEAGSSQLLIDPEFGEDKTPSWAVLNVRAGYQIKVTKKSTLDIKTGILNLFDHYYYRHLDWGNVPRAGRNFYLNVGWKF